MCTDLRGILQDFFAVSCNITGDSAIIPVVMVGAMAETIEAANNDELVLRARTDAGAVGQLYELYYERIFRFCVHRLFCKESAEDVTSTVFLEMARRIEPLQAKHCRILKTGFTP